MTVEAVVVPFVLMLIIVAMAKWLEQPMRDIDEMCDAKARAESNRKRK